MTTVLHTGPDTDLATRYLANALRLHTQAEIAAHLGVTARAVRHWVVNEEVPAEIVFGLQRLLPLELPLNDNAAFSFIDLFAGIGGIRMAFEELGGQCVFTSEWDSYAQKTYVEKLPQRPPHQRRHHQNRRRRHPRSRRAARRLSLPALLDCRRLQKTPSAAPTALPTKRKGTLFFDVCASSRKSSRAPSCSKTSRNLMSHDKGRTFDVIKRSLDDLGLRHPHPHHRRRPLRAAAPRTHHDRRLPQGRPDQLRLERPAAARQRPAEPWPKSCTKTDGSEAKLAWDGDRFFNHAKGQVDSKYT